MDFKIIGYNTDEYEKMIRLRNKILRIPLGLTFSEDERNKEVNDIFLVCKEEKNIIACCVLTKQDEDTLRLRQMAVDGKYQKKGIGREILVFAEKTAKQKGFSKLTLHARETAKNFYRKNGYKSVGSPFTEVGILHIEMVKTV